MGSFVNDPYKTAVGRCEIPYALTIKNTPTETVGVFGCCD